MNTVLQHVKELRAASAKNTSLRMLARVQFNASGFGCANEVGTTALVEFFKVRA